MEISFLFRSAPSCGDSGRRVYGYSVKKMYSITTNTIFAAALSSPCAEGVSNFSDTLSRTDHLGDVWLLLSLVIFGRKKRRGAPALKDEKFVSL